MSLSDDAAKAIARAALASEAWQGRKFTIDGALAAVLPDGRTIAQALDETQQLRAEVAQLDAICAHMRFTALAEYDEEFSFYVGGPDCEHPSLTGDRCDACGWKQDQ